MLIIIMSRSGLKLGHVGSKTRLLGQILEKPCVYSRGQILEKPCVHSRGHRFENKFMKLCQNVNHNNV